MCAPEPRGAHARRPGLRVAPCAADLVEIGARRGQAPALTALLNAQGVPTPACGRVAAAPAQLVLCVRPERWLRLSPPAQPGTTAGAWRAATAGRGIAVDLSSGLAVLHLRGPAVAEVLARSCRLDLEGALPVGHAAATVLAQVAATLAALPSGLLLLTPATTARHVREWLLEAARPFGAEEDSELILNDVLRGDWS